MSFKSKIVRCVVAVVFAVGLMPLPAFATNPQGASAGIEAQTVSDTALSASVEDSSFSVYTQIGDGEPSLAKSYTQAEFASLATTDGAPVSGLYNKGNVWNVSTAITYVTLDDLLADAGVEWDEGASIGYGGDPAQGKAANSFTYEELQSTYFYPNTTTASVDTADAVKAPFVFGIETSDAGIAIGDDQTAADVQAAAASASTTEHAPYAIMGSLESEYVAADGTTVAGKRLWRNVDSVTVTYPEDPIFAVYAQVGDGTPWLVKDYKLTELTDLATTDGDPISGLYYKNNVWNVSTAITYVTLDDLFADAEINWGMGASIGYGGDPAQGKTSNSFTFGQLQNTYFYPNTTATETDTEGAVKAPFVLGVLTSDAGIAIGDDQTAADVQSAAAEASTIEHAPYAIVGSLESEYVAADGTTVQGKRLWRNVDAITVKYPAASSAIYRLYNPYSGEHFYTSSITERDDAVNAGWNYEGVGWYAPDSEEAAPVYRLFNSYEPLGDHHFTTSVEERDTLIAAGWTDEGIGWRSAPETGVPVYREYNPNAYPSGLTGAHNYTTSLEEHEFLGTVGWDLEGTAWFGMGVA